MRLNMPSYINDGQINMRIIFLRKEYLSLLPSMIASLFSANGVAAAIDLCQGYDIKASCHASRQSLSGITQDWSVADGQWLVFRIWPIMPAEEPYFATRSGIFTITRNETGMTLFANNTVTGEYNNGGAIFAKENSTLNLTDVIFPVTSQAAMVAQSILLVLTILVPSIYVSLTPCFAITSLMMAKVAQFIPLIMTFI